MLIPPPPPNETARLEALQQYRVLDTAPEECFDDFTKLAAYICEAPISVISLVDADRQWFKSKVGIDAEQTDRDISFCGHAILEPGKIMVVENAIEDARFFDNPLVTGEPHIRFYAGAPLVNGEGCALGTICVIGSEPRNLSIEQCEALDRLGKRVAGQLELRRVSYRLADALEKVSTLEGLLPICSHCKSIRDDSGYWTRVEEYIRVNTTVTLTHGICPKCIRKNFPDLADDLEKDAAGSVV